MAAALEVSSRMLAAVLTTLAVTGCSAIAPPVTGRQVAGFTAYLADELSSTPEALVEALTVEEAVRRAVRYNHTLRAKELEALLADAKNHVQAGGKLPSIVAENDYYRRDRPHMSHSNLSPAYSTSGDLKTISRDIALSWNILDFGLSYVRTRQGLNKAHQQNEEANRVRARIVEETRSIYWRALALAKLGSALRLLDGEVDDFVRLSRAAARDLRIERTRYRGSTAR